MPVVKCPMPGCEYITEDLDAAVLAVLLTIHNNVHTSSPPGNAKVRAETSPPGDAKVRAETSPPGDADVRAETSPPGDADVRAERPFLLATGTREDYANFVLRWTEYVDASKVSGQDKLSQLLECCDDLLRSKLTTCLGDSLSEKSEEELLSTIEKLLNIPSTSLDRQTAEELPLRDKDGPENKEKGNKRNDHLPNISIKVPKMNLNNSNEKESASAARQEAVDEEMETCNGNETQNNCHIKISNGGMNVNNKSTRKLNGLEHKEAMDSSESEMEVSEDESQRDYFLHAAVEENRTEKMEEFFRKLGLMKYLEESEKISLLEVMSQSSGKRNSLDDIPWYVLLKMLMLDYRGRDDFISNSIEKSLTKDENNQTNSNELMNDYEEIFSMNANKSPNTFDLPHPMDVLIAVIMCSSNFLRQIVCEKLFMCKLSIPLLIPPILREQPLFLLWSLRSTVSDFRLPNGDLSETSVVNQRIPIVSYLRMGEISRSKSKFINEVINDQSHPTFFHRDCQNGMNKRILSEGALEIAWYFPPQQSEKTDLNTNLAFINLRGNGKSDKSAKSLELLCKISSVLMVMIDVDGLGNAECIQGLRSKLSPDTKLILLLTKKVTNTLHEKSKERIRKFVEVLKSRGFQQKNIIFDFDARGENNIKHLKRKTCTLINKCLGERANEMTIEECVMIANRLNINVDEATLECSKSKQIVSAAVKEICKTGMDNLKAKNLPLQCDPWHEWAKLNTEKHRRERRGDDSMDSYMDKISNNMRLIRQKQLQLIERPNILCDAFLQNISDPVNEETLYFLKWMKLHLDEISRQTLPTLQKNCSSKWNEIRQCEDATRRAALQIELDEYEKVLAESSFGLEHFMREVAQAYESVQYMEKEATAKTKEQMQCLPQIMAKLMLLGYPLEIMDGDAAHIPLKWIQAVLDQLSKIIGDKKIFVLSVLGIQSSGKSTMLNTMFGLQFAVAAGRCTRGVFAQLLPVCTEYSGTNYDYILIVDTEGLRAAELGKAKLQHDNEIATLVIGLGDVTLVNIKGENVSEMEDVLQIVVHALLKMSLVNKELKIKPSCVFIHQNVSAQDASQKLRAGQQKFIETLDKVTKAAGKQEDNPQYTRFGQLIDFDINSNIWYISDLWKGDPPMAPVNPGYSENLSNVKRKVLTDIMENRSFHLTADKFCKRLKDLWHGILDQNFVFSFKNSLEMDAYSALESELSDILWSMKSSAMEWFSSKKYVIGNREGDFEKLCLDLASECRKHLDQSFQKAVKTLENFFLTNEDRSYLEQWRANSMLRLKADYSSLTDRITNTIRCEIEKRKVQVEQKRNMKAYIIRIMNEAQTLAEELRLQEGQSKLTENELKNNFREKWNEWMAMIPQKEMVSLNVVEKIYDTLERYFLHDLPVLKKVQEERCKEVVLNNCMKSIKDYATDRKLLSWNGIRHPLTKYTDLALKYLNELVDNVREIVNEKHNQVNQERCAENVIKYVVETVKKLSSVVNFTNVNELKVCLAIFLCQLASHPYYRISKLESGQGKDHLVVAYGIHPSFEKALQKKFPRDIKGVMNKLKPELMLKNASRNFRFDVDIHIQKKENKPKIAEEHVQKLIDELINEVQAYTDKAQSFSEHCIEEMIHMMVVMQSKCEDVTFTKTFRIQLAVCLCQFSIPEFCEKQKRYEEDRDQRLVYERDNYAPCFERFKNLYYMFTDEQALANVLSERVGKGIENAINMDMGRALAEDVRHNVQKTQLKPAFLKAVLQQLLEVDDFNEFFLYITDLDTCLEKWLHYFIDDYLFTKENNSPNKYTDVAFLKIETLTSEVCNEIKREISDKDENSLPSWIKAFHSRVKDKLALPLEDLQVLSEGYEIVSLESFTDHLRKNVKKHQDKIKETFTEHTPDYHEESQEDNVYKLITAECKGCTERCPFCSAPCSLNTPGHQESGKNHVALEHYPEACGRYRWLDSKKLVTESCTMLVAGDARFCCNATNGEYHPYKKYKEIYPDWDIHGDVSVEATPYWKWFLVKYNTQLAKTFEAEVPDIPSSWNLITKEDAMNSLG